MRLGAELGRPAFAPHPPLERTRPSPRSLTSSRPARRGDGPHARPPRAVSAAPISYFTPPPLTYVVGNAENGNGMSPAANAAVLDTALYAGTTTGAASTFWPAGNAYCPLTAGTPLCKSNAATVTTAARLTTVASQPGHLLNVGAFLAQSGGANGTQNVDNGVPVLAFATSTAALPTTFSTRTQAEITDFSTNNWPTVTGPLYAYSGLLVYDTDAFGRVRPFLKAVMYPICASRGGRAAGGERAARGRVRAPQRSSAPHPPSPAPTALPPSTPPPPRPPPAR